MAPCVLSVLSVLSVQRKGRSIAAQRWCKCRSRTAEVAQKRIVSGSTAGCNNTVMDID